MILKSIKWRLQIWYGLILVGVLLGLGIVAYQMERGRMLVLLDDDLRYRFSQIMNAMHSQPNRQGMDRRPFDGPPPDMPDDMPDQNPRPAQFRLPSQIAALFNSEDPHQFYYIVQRDGQEISRSTNAPSVQELELQAQLKSMPPPRSARSGPPQPPTPKTLGLFRFIVQTSPTGETVFLGCSIEREFHQLRMIALKLAGAGGIILFLGMAGGWWIASRAIRPISEISSTATKISAGELAERINVAETESELGQLAAVLNSTFARLEAAFAQQQQFTSDAAHELRTPVTVILTQTQMALGRERDAAGYKQTLEACQRAAQRMRRLIESLLELARFDAGQEKLKHLPLDFAHVVHDCADLIQPLAEQKGIKISSKLSAATIVGDPERLAQVITNLLTNAIQYNQPDGEIHLKLESEKGLAVLTVADTGVGIPPEDLPHVFERFYRADKSRTKSTGNAGLGLAICKAIVEAHSGNLEVSSVHHAGTTFTLSIPLHSAQD